MMAVWSYACSSVESPFTSSDNSEACSAYPLRFLGLGIGVMKSARRRASMIFWVG